MVEANRYRTKIENGRVPSYSGGSALVADFDIDGYDLALSYNTALTELSLKYADIESEKDGEPASSYGGNYFTAPLGKLITLNGKLKLLADQLMLGMSAEVALGNDDTRDSGAKQKGYTVVNLYADYAVLSCLSLRLEVDNLTDRATPMRQLRTGIHHGETTAGTAARRRKRALHFLRQLLLISCLVWPSASPPVALH